MVKEKCKVIHVPKGVCTIYLKGAHIDNIEISQEKDSVCIENLDSNLPCQKECDEK